jgi:hypothetical protein
MKFSREVSAVALTDISMSLSVVWANSNKRVDTLAFDRMLYEFGRIIVCSGDVNDVEEKQLTCKTLSGNGYISYELFNVRAIAQ